MRTALLGAAGIIGRDIARGLAKAMPNVLLADVREDAVKSLAHELGVEAAPVDVTDLASTTRLLRGRDLVVNATWYYHNPKVMEACLAAGANYVDLGGLYHTTRTQLRMHRRFDDEDLLAVLGCGKAPGITNVLAASGAKSFDRLETVRLRSGRRSIQETSDARLPYSAQTLFDEFTLRPVIFERGRLKEIEPLSRREVVHHPEPFGEIEYVTTLHSELATLPQFLGKGLMTMDFQVALPKTLVDMLQRLITLGFASRNPVHVDGASVTPRDLAVAVLSSRPSPPVHELWITEVEMVGRTDGHAVTTFLRVTGDETQNGTALSALTTVGLLRRRKIRGTGVHPPESSVPAKDFLLALRSHGLGVTETRIETKEPGS